MALGYFVISSLTGFMLLWLAQGQAPDATSINIFYTDVAEANTSECLMNIRQVPIKVYSYKYDSVPGRRQLGILGQDVEKYFPDALQILHNYSIPRRGEKPIVVPHFPAVDKNVVFMHGFAALQKLIRLYDEISFAVEHIKGDTQDQKLVFEEIEKRLSKEATDQLVEEKKLAEDEAALAAQEAELQRVRVLHERELIDTDLSQERDLWKYQEELARLRLEREEEFARNSMVEALNFERETTEKKELLRRETEQKLQEIAMENQRRLEEQKASFEKEKIKAEIEARAEQERVNEDVNIRRLQMQSTLDTKKLVEGIKLVSEHVSKVAMELISRPMQLAAVGGIVLLSVLVYYSVRELVSMMRELVQAYLGKPSLVRETSYQSNISGMLKRLVTFGRKSSLAESLGVVSSYFSAVVLSNDDNDRVIQLALATRNTRSSGAPYRHVLLHGPPGTGKTMIARRLAESSDMDYAIMSGGDVGPLGEDAVSQLHGLFRWASRSSRGLLVFIDEAEAFLSTRGDGGDHTSAEHIRHALNALLYQTGTQSRNFMLVLATNRPEDLDPAILDRIDVSLRIGLPQEVQRVGLFEMYMQMNVLDVAKTKKYEVEDKCMSASTLQKMAKRAEGFSGREISKLTIAFQYEMMLDNNGNLSYAAMEKVLEIKLAEHEQKRRFIGADD